MGLGRERFIAEFPEAAEFLRREPPAASTIIGDLYLNRLRGIAFKKPPTWELISLPGARSAQEGIQLQDPEMSDAVREYVQSDDTHAPFVVLADVLRARATGAASKDVDQLAAMVYTSFEGTLQGAEPEEAVATLEEYVADDLELFAVNYMNLRLLQRPISLIISECEAVEYRCTYHFQHIEIAVPIPVRERTVYVLQEPAIYSIRMVDYPDLDPPLAHDFGAILESYRFV